MSFDLRPQAQPLFSSVTAISRDKGAIVSKWVHAPVCTPTSSRTIFEMAWLVEVSLIARRYSGNAALLSGCQLLTHHFKAVWTTRNSR